MLEHWLLIEADLQDRGIDLDDPVVRARSWRWLRVRIVGLLTVESRLHRALYPPAKTSS